MPTIGQKLGETRRSRGLSVEDVAHETRIHPLMIARIEEDDFSQFPSVTYAKSFVRKYGEHLGLDLDGALEALNSGVVRLGEGPSVAGKRPGFGKGRRFRLWRPLPRVRRGPAKRAPFFLNLILLALIGALGLFYFLGYNAATPEQAKEDIARALGLPLPESEPAAEPALEPNPLKAGPAEIPAAAAVGEDLAQGAAPREAGIPPAYPVLKPAVEVSLEDEPRALSGETPSPALRPRETPPVNLSNEELRVPAIPDLPASSRPEPQAVLQPEAVDPAAAAKRAPEPAAESGAPGRPAPQGSPAPPAPGPLRAVPVAASE